MVYKSQTKSGKALTQTIVVSYDHTIVFLTQALKP